MSQSITRRNALTTLAMAAPAVAVGALPTLASQMATTTPDPIFAAIAEHRRAWKRVYRLYDALEAAEWKAPIRLIHWRNYHIGGVELDWRRDALLKEGIDPEVVEREYLDAKARYKALPRAQRAWDRRAGLTEQRRELERSEKAS